MRCRYVQFINPWEWHGIPSEISFTLNAGVCGFSASIRNAKEYIRQYYGKMAVEYHLGMDYPPLAMTAARLIKPRTNGRSVADGRSKKTLPREWS